MSMDPAFGLLSSHISCQTAISSAVCLFIFTTEYVYDDTNMKICSAQRSKSMCYTEIQVFQTFPLGGENDLIYVGF